MDKRPFTCCFTGHRNLPIGQEEEIWKRVYACLNPLLEEGVRYFGVGGALGFDTLVAEKSDSRRSGSGATGNDHFLCYYPKAHGNDIMPILQETFQSQIGGFHDPKLTLRFLQEHF